MKEDEACAALWAGHEAASAEGVACRAFLGKLRNVHNVTLAYVIGSQLAVLQQAHALLECQLPAHIAAWGPHAWLSLSPQNTRVCFLEMHTQ